MFRVKVNSAHPTGSINTRDGEGRSLTIGSEWVPVDSISEHMELYRKYLAIEPIGKTEKVDNGEEKPKRKVKGK